MRKQKLFEQRKAQVFKALELLSGIPKTGSDDSRTVTNWKYRAVLKCTRDRYSFYAGNVQGFRRGATGNPMDIFTVVSNIGFDTTDTTLRLSLVENALDLLIRNWPEVYDKIRDYPLREGEHLYYWLLRTPSRFQQEIAANKRFERQALQNTTIQKLRTLTHAALTDWVTDIDPAHSADQTAVNGVLLPNKE